MNTVLGVPIEHPTPEQTRALMRQAHAERAKVMRDMIAALFTWRRAGSRERPIMAIRVAGKAVPCH